ncbi:hypothetical protein FB45DRAFT_973909 [Roridomyces roridus]|uniref:Uncharacterized protein n=1 Tax=Roridomyces roridus TaxID=1738132 RepID=A0AAD7AWE7_9AGAR|nr:hypothetical protein FB45DRAFT_973909 [Roridomyces roridus]
MFLPALVYILARARSGVRVLTARPSDLVSVAQSLIVIAQVHFVAVVLHRDLSPPCNALVVWAPPLSFEPPRPLPPPPPPDPIFNAGDIFPTATLIVYPAEVDVIDWPVNFAYGLIGTGILSVLVLWTLYDLLVASNFGEPVNIRRGLLQRVNCICKSVRKVLQLVFRFIRPLATVQWALDNTI